MKRSLLLTGALLAFASASAFAQDTTASSAGTSSSASADAAALDLSVPKDPIQYRGDASYSKDPPGTWYGDKTGKTNQVVDSAAAATVRTQQQIAARAEQCQGKLHGSVAMGMGVSSHGGNSNWQGANLNSCKTYYDDDGNAHEIGVSISVGRSSFDGGRGWGGPGGLGWGPGGW